MDSPKGHIILFGKTGEGKSSVANALVTGGIDNVVFDIGHGVRGCTSEIRTKEGRGWTVTDTVGLGEGDGGKVSSGDAEQMIREFLKRVKGEYSHVIYVKSSANRFDVLDEKMWAIFKRVFKGAEEAFTVLFTKHNEKWLKDNWKGLPKWVQELGEEKVFITDIPPVSDKKVREARNQETRRVAIAKLEGCLLEAFDRRGRKYAVPDISNMDDADLEVESKSILAYIVDMMSMLAKPASVVVGVLASAASVAESVASILKVFGLAE